ncbi:hypothetical protein COT72_03590 [archaeon CG10_big_fil_rev_8_21_14_0_10_43_11]|nr:MAG: hypothetical protein COT72_03590 [archaeon CG10_big_fil_rev_8_21_14_0_10_43_11]
MNGEIANIVLGVVIAASVLGYMYQRDKRLFFPALGFFAFVALMVSGPYVTGFFAHDPVAPTCEGCNVVIIVPEVLRKDYLGVYSGVSYTPSIDAFFADAWKFTNYYGTAPWTLPSHTSMLTGLYPKNHKLIHNGYNFSEDIMTMAQYFAKNGYFTISLNGGGHMGADYNLTRGFSYARELYRFENNLDIALDTIEAFTIEPFLMLMSVYDVHDPYNRYGPVSAATGYTGVLASDPISTRSLEHTGELYVQNIVNLSRAFVTSNQSIVTLSDEDVAYFRARYADNVVHLDSKLKSVFDALEARGILNNTIVVLTSNHGEELYEHWLSHSLMYEPVMNTPLLLRIPQATKTTYTKLMSNVDLFPSLSALVGLDVPKNIDGINIWNESHDYIFGESDIPRHKYMVTDGTYKLLVENEHFLGTIELYNIKNDPGENYNVYGLTGAQTYFDQITLFSRS